MNSQHSQIMKVETTGSVGHVGLPETIFDNLADYATLEEICQAFGYSIKTLYAWRSKPERYGTPKDLFHKFGKRLFIRTKVLKRWFKERNKL